MKEKIAFKIFVGLLLACLTIPIVYLSALWTPFGSTKVLLFVFLTECAFPFYIFLLLSHASARPNRKNPVITSALIFLLFTIISGVFGVDPLNSFLGNTVRMEGIIVLIHVFFFFLYLDLSFRIQPNFRKTCIQFLLCISVFTSMIGCLQSLHIIPLFTPEFENRAASLTGNPDFFGASLVIPFFLALDFTFTKKNKKTKYLYIGITISILSGILASQTRGAIFGVLCGGFIYLFLHILTILSKEHRKRLLLICGIGLILSAGVFFSVRAWSPSKSALYRMTHFSDKNVKTRLAYWGYAIDGWKEHPFLGIGYQNFFVIAQKKFASDLYQQTLSWPDKPHNAFLEILATEGLLGAVAYLFLFGNATWMAWKRKTELNDITGIGLITALFAYFIQNLFLFDTIVPLVILFFLFGSISSTHPQSSKSTSYQFASSSWILLLLPLILLFSYILPTAQEFQLIESGEKDYASDRAKSLKKIQEIESLPFIYDQALLAQKAANIQNQELAITTTSTEVSKQATVLAKKTITQAISQHPLQAYYWYRASTIYMLDAQANHSPVDPIGIEAANQAIKLAPARVEAYISLANIEEINGNRAKALDLARRAVEMAPSEPKILWTLAQLYARNNEKKVAAELALESVKHHVPLMQANSLNWAINYFISIQNHEAVVSLYEKAIEIEPNNNNLLPKLAAAYALNGQKDMAIQTVKRLIQKDPSSRESGELFIQSLQ